MICPNCASENEPGARFCNECGTSLAAGCPNCGATNRPGAKFCNECGTTLVAGVSGGQPVADQQAPAGGAVAERKLVTVLFADMVGFTPFAEERDAEDVRETLSRYFELCAEVIGRYGGTVEKYIGDAVMAVWGAPVAHEDDAERAVRAALDLVDSVPTLGPSLQARAGVLTGEAAVTLGATNQGLVAGDLVNTASRLQSVAEPGSVLVGETTMRSSSSAVLYEEAGDQALKGKQAPVAAWRALRIVSEVGGRNRSDQLEAPFVGRADELRLLKDLFHATGREQKVRLVSVMGPAGIGKSRLAWEFLKYVDGLVETTYWHSGRSPAYGEGISFWALGEMIRGRCGLVETDDADTTRVKVDETVEQWVPDEAERAWITPALLTLLGVDSGMASDQLFAAWRTFFERISAQGTVTLVFEDMHFADLGLLDFIEHLMEWSRGFPIYVVTLARPELLERRSDWGAGKRAFTSIYLEPLTADQMHELLAGLVPGLPQAATRAIVDRADGIPLYAVETVRMLVVDGRLVLTEGSYEPVGDLTSLAVPETLTALIASRLDALDPVDRGLMHDAAVLGQSFTSEALAAVSGMPEAELEQRTSGLIRRELLTREVDARSAERGQLAFVQALIREVAYNTLAKRDRKRRHLAAARHFEGIGSDELAGALANHYTAAYRNASEGPEADALAAQARVALRAAAERAVALGAHDQAVGFLEQALEVTTDPAEQADLLERAAVSARVAARYDAAWSLASRALELRRQAGDRPGATRASTTLGFVLLGQRKDSEARELLEAAHAEFVDLWPDIRVAELKTMLARALGQFGENRRAIELADEALEVAERANDAELLARGLFGKGVALGSLGRLREGIALIKAGEDLARENSLTEELLGGLMLRGFHLGEVDNVAAVGCYREGLELARRVGHREMAVHFVNNVGYSGFLVGDWDYALSEMDAALAEDVEPGGRVWLLSNALIIRAARGDDVAAGMEELDVLVEPMTSPQTASAPMDTKANLAQAEGRLEDAVRYWTASGNFPAYAPAAYYQAARPAFWAGDKEAVVGFAEQLDATGFHGPVVEARRSTLKAMVAALEGRSPEALELYVEARAAWRGLRVTWEEALTALDMATVFDPTIPEVHAAATEARAIFERLGARPYLERLDEALARPRGAPTLERSTAELSTAKPATSG